MNNYLIYYAIEPIVLYGENNLDGKTLIQAEAIEEARNAFMTGLLSKGISAEILDIQEIENLESILNRIKRN